MTRNTNPPTGNRLMLVDCTRGIAAVAVAVAHGIYFVSKPTTFQVDPLHHHFRFGARAVDFFFVLSGFVISYVHWSDLGRKLILGSYAAKRFIRVYPILWIVALPVIAAALVVETGAIPPTWPERAGAIFGTLTLLPTPMPPVPIVVWTLKHEILFYALYALVLWRPRLGLGLFAAWAAACFYHGLGGMAANFITDFVFSPYNLEFMLGVGCGYFMRTRSVRFPLAVTLLGAALFLWAGITFQPPPLVHAWIPNPTTLWQVLQFGSGSALMVLGLSQIDLQRRVAVPKVLTLCGAASYAIYLIHLPVISLGVRIVKSGDRFVAISPLAAFVLLVLAGVTAGIALHLLVEVPMLRIVRRVILPSPKSTGRKETAVVESAQSPAVESATADR
jgi:peptidoglycan/LPS O-acetylase OafA/YrhL